MKKASSMLIAAAGMTAGRRSFALSASASHQGKGPFGRDRHEARPSRDHRPCLLLLCERPKHHHGRERQAPKRHDHGKRHEVSIVVR
jgi:hypothetical protein